jgi:uncharacterized protein (TIGR02678 family)
MRSLSDALRASRDEEQRKAARALLRRPLLRASGPEPESFVLVRRHAAALREWFDRNTGWRLLVDSEVARLVKAAAGTDDHTHPARELRTGQPFSRRRYVLVCLALAALERADTQVTLGRLAEQVVLGAVDPELGAAGVVFTLDSRDQRADLAAVVRLLLDLGVLSRVAGDEDAFVKDTGDALYDVERRVLATMLVTPRGPSTVEAADFAARLAAVTGEATPGTDELRNRTLRHRLTRRLLDDPVLYYDELDEDEVAYLASQRAAITARITELTGLVAEVRAEGVAMVDPGDDLSDVRMPDSGTDGHVTLLLAEYLAARMGRPVPVGELHGHVQELAVRHRSYWRRNATDPGAEAELTAVALSRLEALRLVRRHAGEVTGRPALARYAVAAPTIHEPNTAG